MEWVETTARTIEEAKEHALDQLGVAEDEAEFEVLDEPRAGLFGRVRGEARVRARVRPDAAAAEGRAAAAPQGRRRGTGTKAPATSAKPADGAESNGGRSERPRRERPPRPDDGGDRSTKEDTPVDPEQVAEEARRFMQGLVDAFGLAGTAAVRRDGDDVEVAVDGTDLGLLVGPRGTTLQAVQELARVAAQRRLGDHDTRLRIDVAGYRERRREALGKFATQVAAEVVEAGVGAPSRADVVGRPQGDPRRARRVRRRGRPGPRERIPTGAS